MVVIDSQIQGYINEKKTLPPDFKTALKPRDNGHLHYECEIKGENGNTFTISIRQSKFNLFDFSVIFGVMLGNGIFRIKRYNGNSHHHTNKIENEAIDGFHIHIATERYQNEGFKEDTYATKSTKHWDLPSALKLMLIENNFKPTVPRGQSTLEVQNNV